MATEEIKASLDAAEYHMKLAGNALQDGVFWDCVYHSASAAENAVNALILELGGRPPHTHRDAETLERVVVRMKPEWLESEEFKQVLERMRGLEEHIVKPRYPIEVEKGKFIPPHEYHKGGDAKRMFRDASFIVDAIKRFMIK